MKLVDRLRQQRGDCQNDMEVLGLSLFPSSENENWMEADPEQQVITTMQVHQGWSPPASTIMHSFVGMRLHDGRMPPAVKKTE